MKPVKKLFILLTTIAALFFTSCNSKFLISAADSHTAAVSFSLKFPRSFIETGKAITGKDELPVNGTNITQILMAAGFDKISSNSTNYSIIAGGLYDCNTEIARKTQILNISSSSISLSLGPEQFKSIYAMMNEEEQSYFDLMMIPCLSDEESTVEEYEETVASLYGPSFARDLTHGVITFTLASPDGKKVSSNTITLGELFTLKETKEWKLDF